MSRILVTGASGYIGSHVVRSLAATDLEVHAAGRRRAGSARAVYHEVNLLAPGEAETLIERVRPSHLLHLAWYAEPGAFWSARENLDWVGATARLLEAFAQGGGSRFVGAGTCAEYDWSGDGMLLDERATPLMPATLYGACKLATWHIVRAFSQMKAISHAWGRIFFLYGPGEPAGKLVGSVTRALLRGEEARTTTGEQIRDFMHVADVADALVALTVSDVEGAVNLGSGRGVAVRDLVLEIGDLLGTRDRIALGAVPMSRPEAARVVANVRRLSDEVGWEPRISLRDGLAATIEHLRREGGA